MNALIHAARVSALALAATLCACTVGPDYKTPMTDAPPTWRTDSYWRLAQPSHAPLAPYWNAR